MSSSDIQSDRDWSSLLKVKTLFSMSNSMPTSFPTLFHVTAWAEGFTLIQLTTRNRLLSWKLQVMWTLVYWFWADSWMARCKAFRLAVIYLKTRQGIQQPHNCPHDMSMVWVCTLFPFSTYTDLYIISTPITCKWRWPTGNPKLLWLLRTYSVLVSSMQP